ncbi:MAG: hypothetical protein K0R54_517 [Clostridiaceae bacterium]|jgi:hypothetical protein|nr:hypothetical protein [Clostridiaceae bacterium]
MNWIDIKDQQPPDSKDCIKKEYLVTVICNSWEEPETMVMEWECTIVKNKVVKRWKWKNRLVVSAWTITHWMEFPKPMNKLNKNTHVYCTQCKHGDELFNELLKDTDFTEPQNCIGCDSSNPEDSMTFENRPNYVKKRREIIDKFCTGCNKEMIFNYISLDKTVPKGEPDVLVKCEECGNEQHISEKDWTLNCRFI